jgi:membrane fusion protein (multidrug efflux system)
MKRITILSGLIALISLTSCNSKQEEKEVAETYSVTNPITIDTSFTKEYVSNSVYKNIEIRALEKGSCKKFTLMKVNKKEGQLLFKILPTVYEAE